ncbi:to TPR Domain [Geosmithia morbida]|uniref:To TPR Domain n=1 Tax=Geosmithia morbida TaxID=1094350 RepID=A0A9P4YW71_9HYPO|nr:to TPR Domain [Geosmithia morbida]KAF4122904.1 to TPR Domain [Geosmithia morbida]
MVARPQLSIIYSRAFLLIRHLSLPSASELVLANPSTMPRPRKNDSCNTCRRRKIKCSGESPICNQCTRAERYCDWYRRSLDFRPWTGSTRPSLAGNREYEPPSDPRATLKKDQHLAKLFTHYIVTIADWYDLSDASRCFAVTVPLLALDEPLLFCATIALSAMHRSKTSAAKLRDMAEYYHQCCIKLLIKLKDGDALMSNGVALAATCLLRSYEILDGGVDPNRHLRGAYSMASQHQGLLSGDGLLVAGSWNYLREDITYSLYEKCPLKIDLETVPLTTTHETDQHYLNSASLVLGKLINLAFDHALTYPEWEAALFTVRNWATSLPNRIMPFSVTDGKKTDTARPLPLVSFLQPCHTASVHYFLVALFILADHAPLDRLDELLALDPFDDKEPLPKEDLQERWALYISGSAFDAMHPLPTVLVNAFGPMAYCARKIRDKPAQQELVRQLIACKPSVGWPVDRLKDDLLAFWQSSG